MSDDSEKQLSMADVGTWTPPSEYAWIKQGAHAWFNVKNRALGPVLVLETPTAESLDSNGTLWVNVRFFGHDAPATYLVGASRLSPAASGPDPASLGGETEPRRFHGKWQIGEPFSASVIDTATAIHGDVTGSGDVLLGDGLERAVAWLEWRVREGWHDRGMSEAVHFEEHVRSLAKAAVVLGQQALNERYAEERAEAFQRRGTTRAESGPMQFGDDWAGVFLRGDDAAAMLNWLQQLEKVADGMNESQLRAFARATSRFLRSKLGHGDHLHMDAGGQARNCTQMRAFAECVAPTTDKEMVRGVDITESNPRLSEKAENK